MLPTIDIGNTIRNLRYNRNLSQDQLARMIGVNKSTIAHYEGGLKLPSLPKLIALARTLKVSTDYLLGINKGGGAYLDVTGLTPKQIQSLNFIIENYLNM